MGSLFIVSIVPMALVVWDTVVTKLVMLSVNPKYYMIGSRLVEMGRGNESEDFVVALFWRFGDNLFYRRAFLHQRWKNKHHAQLFDSKYDWCLFKRGIRYGNRDCAGRKV